MSQRLASPHLDISAQTLLLSEGHAPTLRPAVTPYPLSCLQQGPPSDTPCNLLVYLFICLSPLLWNITPQVQEYVSILFPSLPRGLKHCLPHSRHSISICWIRWIHILQRISTTEVFWYSRDISGQPPCLKLNIIIKTFKAYYMFVKYQTPFSGSHFLQT